MMFRITAATTFTLAAAISLAACASEQDGSFGEPIPIDDALLMDTFEACELDIDTCLEDDGVAEEIDRRIAAGEWIWADDDDDGLDAAVTYYRYTGCTFSATARRTLSNTCQRSRARLVSYTLLRHCSGGSGTHVFRGKCRK